MNKRILLCEDHPLNAKIAIRLLENVGAKIVYAVNGREGLEIFSKSDIGFFDAVLMDIRMPVMDGIDAARAIRGLGRADAAVVPIISMTANSFDSDIAVYMRAGMNAFIEKPIDLDKLYIVLSDCIEKAKSVGEAPKEKLLIVDDVPLNISVLRAMLEIEYDIYEAASAKEAIEILKSGSSFLAMITDIQMPEMDGVELIRYIREKHEYDRMFILANTQYGDEKQEEIILEAGADDFIYKPSSLSLVRKRISNLTRMRR